MDWDRTKKCLGCGERVDYMNLTTEGLCPKCAEEELQRLHGKEVNRCQVAE